MLVVLRQPSSSLISPLDSLDSAFHAQDGDQSLISTHYLSATFIFNEEAKYADTASRFTLLSTEAREKAQAPPELREFVEPSDNVHLISLVICRGVAEINVNSFKLVPYSELGYQPFPYLSSWAEWLVEELKEENPYGDPWVTAIKQLNADESETPVNQLRAQKTLQHRYPDAPAAAELWVPRKYTDVSGMTLMAELGADLALSITAGGDCGG